MAVHLYSLFTVEREQIELLLNSSALYVYESILYHYVLYCTVYKTILLKSFQNILVKFNGNSK